MAKMIVTESPEIKTTKSIERLLVKADRELAALDPANKAWVEDYLRARYGWFVRGTGKESR